MPLCWQGLESHSLISVSQFAPESGGKKKKNEVVQSVAFVPHDLYKELLMSDNILHESLPVQMVNGKWGAFM